MITEELCFCSCFVNQLKPSAVSCKGTYLRRAIYLVLVFMEFVNNEKTSLVSYEPHENNITIAIQT